MKKLIQILILLLVLALPAFAQRNYIKNRVLKGEELQKKYPGQDFLIKEHKVEIDFKFGEVQLTDQQKKDQLKSYGDLMDDGPIHGIVNDEYLFYNLKDYVSLNRSLYRSQQSYISQLQKVTVKPRKTKKKYSSLVYRTSQVSSSGFFHNDMEQTKFSIPFDLIGGEKGYKMTEVFGNVKYLNAIYFNDDYPTLKRTLEINIPNGVEIQVKEMNFAGFGIEKKTKKTKLGKKIIYTIWNAKAFPNEYKSVGSSYTFPHVLIAVKNYDYQGKSYDLLRSTDDLYKWYSSLVKACSNKPEELKPLVTTLLQGKTTDEEKIKALYYWVQDNIRYIAFEDGIAGFKPEDAYKVNKNKYGDCKGMANLLKEMLVIAGYDARLTWIGTRKIAYDYSFPSLYNDNHMICSVKLGNKWLFLDGTEKYQHLGQNAYRIRGKQVMVENGDAYHILTVPNGNAHQDLDSIHYSFNVKGDLLMGNVVSVQAGENKTSFLHYYNNVKSPNKYRLVFKWLAGNDKNLSLDTLTCKNCDDREKAIRINYEIKARNHLYSSETKKFLSYDFDKRFTYFELDSTRKSAYEFNEFVNFKRVYEFKWKKKIDVEYAPKDINIQNDEFFVKASIKVEQKRIVVYKEVRIPNGRISVKNLKAWEEANKLLKLFINDQLILKH